MSLALKEQAIRAKHCCLPGPAAIWRESGVFRGFLNGMLALVVYAVLFALQGSLYKKLFFSSFVFV